EWDPEPKDISDSSEYETDGASSEDVAWLAKKKARSKLEKWRKAREVTEGGAPDTDEIEVEKTCRTCYYCSSTKEFNGLWYVKCTKKESAWLPAEDDLPCWKLID
ncbi:MAG: hypothetical protein ACFE7R_08430, partial [Candidatus Hodarchaeota archaeon]